MKIIEQFCKGKINEDANEDGIFINENFIAVIDGITAKGNKLYNGKKSGRMARDLLLECLKNLKPNMTKEEVISTLNESLKQSENMAIEDMPSAGIIIYSDFFKELWVFGDCQCMVNGSYYDNSKEFDTIASLARSLFIHLSIEKGFREEELLENDIGLEYINPLLKIQPILENNYNSPFGYSVLNGREINLDKIKTISVKENDEIILASDGYPFLKPTLEQSEAELKQLLQEDPFCFKKYKTTKGLKKGQDSYDDRSYIRFII